MNSEKLQQHINSFWDNAIIPTISEYIKIPNKSPAFDPDWEAKGYMDSVVALASVWVKKNKPENSTLHIYKETGKEI